MKKITLTFALATALFTSMTLLNCSKKEDPAPAATTSGTTTAGTTTSGTTTSGTTTSGTTTSGTTSGTTTSSSSNRGTGTGSINDGTGIKNGVADAIKIENIYTLTITPPAVYPLFSLFIYTNGSTGTFGSFDSNTLLGSTGAVTYSDGSWSFTSGSVTLSSNSNGKLVGTFSYTAQNADKTASKTVTGSFDVTFK